MDDDSVVDLAGNELGGTGTNNGNFTGQEYTIDATVPVVSDFGRSVDEDLVLSFVAGDFTDHFADADGDNLAAVKVVSLPGHGMLSLAGTPLNEGQEIAAGQFGDLTYQGALDYNGLDGFAWDGCDGAFYSGAPATVFLTINSVNDPPVLGAIADQNVNEQALFTYAATATDQDVPGQTLSYSLDQAPSGMTINATSGLISWTPGEDQGSGASYPVTVRVTDNGTNPANLYATKSFTITVAEVNVAPVLSGIADQNVSGGTERSGYSSSAVDPSWFVPLASNHSLV